MSLTSPLFPFFKDGLELHDIAKVSECVIFHGVFFFFGLGMLLTFPFFFLETVLNSNLDFDIKVS
jgi:hypothetical protein